ncbi:MAG: hypothetical protein MRZ50_03555 [Prevotella sp.]|nr:hypothetical protein [Prevotella sp.]
MIIGITRAERFSPNSTDKDRAIMQAVIGLLRGKMIAEEDFCGLPPGPGNTILSMARLPRTLQLLKQCEASGTTVINPARGVENCRRSVLDGIMRSAAIPMPPTTGKDGYWIKRGDAAAQSPSDVVFCENEAELELAEKRFTDSGITDYVVSAHVCGDLVKFYGVEGTGFFRVYYPTEDGISKFGDEKRNGIAHHYDYDTGRLQSEAERLSALVGTPIYGGDAVISASGEFFIIDFNDWPSFARCREDAARAIAGLVERINGNGK